MARVRLTNLPGFCPAVYPANRHDARGTASLGPAASREVKPEP